jgi:probable rRNA maturation factor
VKATVDLQIADPGPSVPNPAHISEWVEAVMADDAGSCEICVRIVSQRESRRLNQRFRGRPTATNVLAFPADLPAGPDLPLLGDLVVCRAVVEREAGEQGKPVEAHWAHMVVHGTLHLLGYDHNTEQEEARMEAREVQILATLGYPDPYEELDRGGPSAPPAIG